MLFGFNRIGYKLDAVISGFAIGAGFSVVENILYLTIYPDYGAGTWLVRGLGTAVMHGTTLAILAAIAHELAERETREAAGDFNFSPWWFVPGYPRRGRDPHRVQPIPRPAAAGDARRGRCSRRSRSSRSSISARPRRSRWLVAERAEHKAQLDALRAGGWPDSASGAQDRGARRPPRPGSRQARPPLLGAAGLARRSRPRRRCSRKPPAMRKLTGRTSAPPSPSCDGLSRALGPSTFAALKPLLPFSRNDDWEMSELKQRLDRDGKAKRKPA